MSRGRLKFNSEYIYVINVVLAFGLLFFANADNIEVPDGNSVSLGIGKSFYVPCLIAFISSFFIKKTHDHYDKLFTTLIVLGIISSFIHPPQQSNPLAWTLTRFTFGILCFKDLKTINPYLFAKFVTIASPIILIPHYIITNPFGYGAYRYAGFYGDANFLAIALILLIVCNYITILKESNKLFSIIGYFSIVCAIPLILVGMSRGGLIGLGLIMFAILSNLKKTNKTHFYLIVILFIFSIGSLLANFSDLFSSIISRFMNESDSDNYSTMARLYGIQSALTVFSNCPILIPFGVGLGNTIFAATEYAQYGVFYKAEIHNTFFSLMYEGGIIMAFVYLSIFFKIFKTLFRFKNYLLIAMLLSLFISLNTLPGVSFMPAWITLFFLCNNNLMILNKKV